MIDKLIDLNEQLIKKNFNNPTELKKQLLIKKILNEKDVFTKIKVETAYNILKDLQISSNDLKTVYMELI